MSQCVNFGSPSFDMFLTSLWFVSSAVVAHVPCLGSGLLSVWPERPEMPVLHDGEFKPGSPAGATGLQASAVVCIPTANCSGASSARLCAAWRVRTALDPHQCPVGYDSVNYHPNSMLGWSGSVKNQLSSSHSRSYSGTFNGPIASLSCAIELKDFHTYKLQYCISRYSVLLTHASSCNTIPPSSCCS